MLPSLFSVIWLLSNFSLPIAAPLIICSTPSPSPPHPSTLTHTQICDLPHEWSLSAPITVPSCLTLSAAPYWSGFVTATSCADVVPGPVPSLDRKVGDKEKGRQISNVCRWRLKTGCRQGKDFPFRVFTTMTCKMKHIKHLWGREGEASHYFKLCWSLFIASTLHFLQLLCVSKNAMFNIVVAFVCLGSILKHKNHF